MSFERILEGIVAFIDRQNRTLRENHYVTESGGKCVANTIAIVEPMSKPGSFSGVRVAG